jgi:hypothetical protein
MSWRRSSGTSTSSKSAIVDLRCREQIPELKNSNEYYVAVLMLAESFSSAHCFRLQWLLSSLCCPVSLEFDLFLVQVGADREAE